MIIPSRLSFNNRTKCFECANYLFSLVSHAAYRLSGPRYQRPTNPEIFVQLLNDPTVRRHQAAANSPIGRLNTRNLLVRIQFTIAKQTRTAEAAP